MWPFKKKSKPEIFLKPGTCVCSHGRQNHQQGKGPCATAIQYEPGKWATCACQVYIPKPDDDTPPVDPAPTPAELEKLYQLK
jgi:hypothetical protein